MITARTLADTLDAHGFSLVDGLEERLESLGIDVQSFKDANASAEGPGGWHPEYFGPSSAIVLAAGLAIGRAQGADTLAIPETTGNHDNDGLAL